MWKGRITIFLFVLTFSMAVSAQNGTIGMQLVNRAKTEWLPGATSNIVIRLINNSTENKEISLSINTPTGWKCFSNLKGIKLRPSERKLKILSFSISNTSNAGDYTITIEAYNKQQNRRVGEITVPIQINPRYELDVSVIDAPEYVFSGDTFSVQFMLQNLSNIRTNVHTILKGAGETEESSYALMPNSPVFITKTLTAEKNIIKHTKKNVSLTAILADTADVKTIVHHFYNVIPSKEVKFDPYIQFPVNISSLFMTDNSRGERIYAFIGEVTGQGFLDNKGTRKLSFRFRGPDRRGKPLYGINDEYFLKYSSPRSEITLGDNTYQLSYLTEYSRYGRGASIKQRFNQISIGSFINYPRFYSKIKQEYGVYAGFISEKKIELNAGYLNKQNEDTVTNHLYTFNGRVSPFSWTKWEWEYALGSVEDEYKQALKAELRVTFKPIQLLYNYTMAEKDYPGYFTDTRYMLANGNINLFRRINLGVNYSYRHQNTALDTIYSSSAPYSENFVASFNYRILKNTRLSASYNIRKQKDRMTPMKFHYDENSLRIMLNSKLRRLGIDVLGEYGRTESFLNPEEAELSDMYRGRLTLNYMIAPNIGFNSFVNYLQSERYSISDLENWFYGGSFNARLGKKANITVNYQSNYDVEEAYRDRSIFDMRFDYAPNNKNSFEFSARHNLVRNSLDVNELAFIARYTRTINIPVAKKENIGKLSGRLINKGVKNVEGIVLSLGGNQTITNEDGDYSFPVLAAGSYYLIVDYSNAGIDAIPENPGPYRLEIVPEGETNFDIALTRSSRITGELVIEKQAVTNDKEFAEVKEKLGKLIIEAKSENEVFREFTDENGEFTFESLRPGQWTVKVYDRLPREYELATNQFTINLTSDLTEHIEVRIKEKRRKIKFQKSFNKSFNIKKDSTIDRTVSKTNQPIVSNNPQSTSDEAKEAGVSLISKGEIEYRVQICANLKKRVPIRWMAKKYNIKHPIERSYYNNFHIYTVGSFATYNEARKLRDQIRAGNEIPGAFVVTFKDGKRYK